MKKLLGSMNIKHNLNILVLSPTQIIVIGFISLIIAGTILLSLPISSRSGHSAGFINALFTATSAVCVTGLVVVDTNSYWSSFGQTIILILIQVGGLGIMSMATLFSLIIGRRMSLKERMTIQESLNEFSLSGVVRMLKNILIATFVIEFLGTLILMTRLIPLYGVKGGVEKSIFHSVSAFCNAGFDIFGTQNNQFTSLTMFKNDPVIVVTISLLFIIGGLGFVVWKDVVSNKRFSDFMLHTKVVLLVTSLLIVLGTILIFVLEVNNSATLKDLPFWSKILNAYFHAATPRTAGFNTLPLDKLTDASKFLTIILMFIGAAPGSTGGGIKVTTFSVIIISVISYIKGQEDTNIMQRRVPHNILIKSLSIAILATTAITITTMILLVNREGSFLDAFFEATSAFGTVGLSTGITPALNNASKFMVIITMFMGRVGPLSAALTLTLRQSNKKLPYKYPEGKITVG